MADQKKVECLVDKEKKKNSQSPSRAIHVCYMCQREFRCNDVKKGPGQKDLNGCLCDMIFVACPCPKCSNPQSTVKGIAAVVCRDNCEDDYYDDDDSDDDDDDGYELMYRY